MIRKAFVMTVTAGQEAEYARRHQPIWAALAAVLHPETRQLFAYVEIESEARWAAVARTEVCQRWWKHMGDIMPGHPDHSPVSTALQEMFHLE